MQSFIEFGTLYKKNTIIGVIHDQMLIDKKKIKLLYVGGFGEGKC